MKQTDDAKWHDLSRLWDQQSAPDLPETEIESLLGSVRRHHRAFRRSIFWRDIRESLVGLLLAAFFSYVAFSETGYARAGACVLVAACVGVTVAFCWTRFRARRIRPAGDHDLRKEIEASLAEVEFQICLLRNVRWWYLMPLAFGLLAWLFGSVIESPTLPSVVGFVLVLPIIGLVFAWVERLNHKAIREDLSPRAESLQSLIDQFPESAGTDH